MRINVDLTNQMINLITAKNAYKAAADVINNSDQLLKSVLAIA